MTYDNTSIQIILKYFDFGSMESKEINQIKFGKAILEVAEQKQLSLRRLSAASGLEFSQVQRITKGKVNLALSTIISLAEGLEIKPSELFKYFEESKNF